MSLLVAINVLLRFITKEQLVLFAVVCVSTLALPSCLAIDQPQIGLTYQLDDGSQVTVILKKKQEDVGKNPIPSK